MTRIKVLTRCATAIALVSCHALAAEEADSDLSFFTLENGLRVVIEADETAPTVSVVVLYHVGSKNEVPGQRGFAHLYEHLMFNGSEHYDGEYFVPLRAAGGTQVGGGTARDYTYYHQVVPANGLETVLWMESDRMGYLLGVIDQEKLDEQRSVVHSEIGGVEDEIGGLAIYRQMAGFYPSEHPYSWRPLGVSEEIDEASLADVRQWFTDFYGAANAVLSIVGNVDATDARTLVEQYFAEVRSGTPLARTREWVVGPDANVYEEMLDRVEHPRIERWWAAPGSRSEEVAAMTVLEAVLGEGRNSLLYDELVARRQLAASVDVEFEQMELMSLMILRATAAPGISDRRLSAAIDESIDGLIRNGPAEIDVNRAKVAVQLAKASRNERGLRRAFDYALGVLVADDPALAARQLELIEGIHAADVQAAAARWLTRPFHEMTILPLSPYRVAEQGADRSRLPVIDALPPPVFPDVHRFSLDNGIEVHLAERHAVPIVNMTMQFQGGTRGDRGLSGVAGFTFDMLDEGQRGLSAAQVAAALYDIGGSVAASVTEDIANIGLSFLSDEMDSAVDLFAGMILTPSFRSDDIDRVRNERVAALNSMLSNPMEAMSNYVIPLVVYGRDHPYGRHLAGLGTHQDIAAITPEHVTQYHRIFVTPDNARLIVVGDTNEAELRAVLERAFSSWTDGPGPGAPDTPLAAPRRPGSNVILIDQPGMSQVSILVMGALDTGTVEDDAALFAVNDVLGGQFVSRLNLNLREDKGWSYGAMSRLWPKQVGTMWGSYSLVRSDKAVESMLEISNELKALAGDRPMTEEELALAKQSWGTQLMSSLEGNGDVAEFLLNKFALDRAEDYDMEFQRALTGLTLAHVNAAADKLADFDNLTWLVVGDLMGREREIEALGLGEIQRWRGIEEALSR